METLIFEHGAYLTASRSSSWWTEHFPSVVFYLKLLQILHTSSQEAKRHQYNGARWGQSSLRVLRALESVGVTIDIRGVEHISAVEGPCVFIANHMSTLETLILPSMIQPIKDVTFIVKQSLLEYPIFKHILNTRHPITVTRNHPREDFKAVLEGGLNRLQNGHSIIVFPQTTRTTSFEPSQFNTIGIKLAKRAQVPVIPVALLTDAWEVGGFVKEIGKINTAKHVCFAFGAPLPINGRGDAEHAQVVEFIGNTLNAAARLRQ